MQPLFYPICVSSSGTKRGGEKSSVTERGKRTRKKKRVRGPDKKVGPKTELNGNSGLPEPLTPQGGRPPTTVMEKWGGTGVDVKGGNHKPERKERTRKDPSTFTINPNEAKGGKKKHEEGELWGGGLQRKKGGVERVGPSSAACQFFPTKGPSLGFKKGNRPGGGRGRVGRVGHGRRTSRFVKNDENPQRVFFCRKRGRRGKTEERFFKQRRALRTKRVGAGRRDEG